MRNWGKSGGSWLRQFLVGAVVLTLSVVGCGKKGTPEPAASKTDSTQPATDSGTRQKPAGSDTTEAVPIERDRLHQSFADATRDANNPPPGSERPHDMTRTNKPTFKILEAVKKSWDTIRFVDAAKKPIHYTAVIETDFGTIEIELKPGIAPNHVRNFIALARAGYYDGLLFDRVLHQESAVADDPSPLKLDLVEAGCPVGTGEPASGSIGYWLKPEFNEKTPLKHVEGTVGACHESEADTAATRFYIILNEAPYLDGNSTVFGQLRKGSLDVVRKIAQQPVIVVDPTEGSRRPEKPIVIKKVTIKSETGAQS